MNYDEELIKSQLADKLIKVSSETFGSISSLYNQEILTDWLVFQSKFLRDLNKNTLLEFEKLCIIIKDHLDNYTPRTHIPILKEILRIIGSKQFIGFDIELVIKRHQAIKVELFSIFGWLYRRRILKELKFLVTVYIIKKDMFTLMYIFSSIELELQVLKSLKSDPNFIISYKREYRSLINKMHSYRYNGYLGFD